jgi:hypothetical protein
MSQSRVKTYELSELGSLKLREKVQAVAREHSESDTAATSLRELALSLDITDVALRDAALGLPISRSAKALLKHHGYE